jgi:hypothetical protein
VCSVLEPEDQRHVYETCQQIDRLEPGNHSPPALVGTDRPHMRNITLHTPPQIRLNLQILQRILSIRPCLAFTCPRLRESRPISMWYRAWGTDGRWGRDGGIGGRGEEGGECCDLGFRQGGDESLFVYL